MLVKSAFLERLLNYLNLKLLIITIRCTTYLFVGFVPVEISGFQYQQHTANTDDDLHFLTAIKLLALEWNNGNLSHSFNFAAFVRSELMSGMGFF